MGSEAEDKEVLFLYTGGTMGMVHQTIDPESPLVVGPSEEVFRRLPIENLKRHGINLICEPSISKDSSNIGFSGWVDMAQKIHRHGGRAVIGVGTDTAAYIASALSFMLENQSFPVVLTGSQLPIYDPRSDAEQNISNSALIAAGLDPDTFEDMPIVPSEVCVFSYLDSLLLRGNRVIEKRVGGGFHSPNYPPIAKVGRRVEFRDGYESLKPRGEFKVNTRLNDKCMVLPQTPGDSFRQLLEIVMRNDYKCLIIDSYMDGGSALPDHLQPLKEAKDSGLSVVMTTSQEGGLYLSKKVSAELEKMGVVLGRDMTPVAALAKAYVLFGKYEPPKATALMGKNIRGEMRGPLVAET